MLYVVYEFYELTKYLNCLAKDCTVNVNKNTFIGLIKLNKHV